MIKTQARWSLLGVIFAATSLLGACSFPGPVDYEPAVDDRLERTNRVARVAFQQGYYARAFSLYQQALDIAYQRDEVNAVVDAQYNAAVCLVRLDRVDEAGDLVERAKTELVRSGSSVPVELSLLEAAILYRQSRYDQAWSITKRIELNAPNTQAANRAQFLQGLIAADQGDASGVRTAIANLGKPTDARLSADRLELAGHLALLEQRYPAAVDAFREAARLRSTTFDYRGTVRALEMAGEASEKAGDIAQASVHYLRAGRSALHQGTNERARELLTKSLTLADQAGDAETASEAQKHLTSIPETEPESGS